MGRNPLAPLTNPFAFRCTGTEKKTFGDLDDEQVYFQLDNIYKQLIHNVNYLLYINQLYIYTGSRLLRGRLQ